MSEENMTFEQLTSRTAEIVKLLENQKTPLDESLSLFEEGVSLIARAEKMLEDAQRRVNVLTAAEQNGDNA